MIIAHYWVDKAMVSPQTTVASSGLIQAFCEQQDCTYYETAVGFKHFSPLFDRA